MIKTCHAIDSGTCRRAHSQHYHLNNYYSFNMSSAETCSNVVTSDLLSTFFDKFLTWIGWCDWSATSKLSRHDAFWLGKKNKSVALLWSDCGEREERWNQIVNLIGRQTQHQVTSAIFPKSDVLTAPNVSSLCFSTMDGKLNGISSFLCP